jgi:adenylylsulfate kinase-like enzyme
MLKDLYKRARKGEIKGFTEVDDVYEVPSKPDLIIYTENTTLECVIACILEYLHEAELVSYSKGLSKFENCKI